MNVSKIYSLPGESLLQEDYVSTFFVVYIKSIYQFFFYLKNDFQPARFSIKLVFLNDM